MQHIPMSRLTEKKKHPITGMLPALTPVLRKLRSVALDQRFSAHDMPVDCLHSLYVKATNSCLMLNVAFQPSHSSYHFWSVLCGGKGKTLLSDVDVQQAPKAAEQSSEKMSSL